MIKMVSESAKGLWYIFFSIKQFKGTCKKFYFPSIHVCSSFPLLTIAFCANIIYYT